jgi:hypothetical protein
MSNLQRLTDGSIVMCCGGKGCPTLKIDNDQVSIKDDYGNKITITEGEAELIQQALDQAKQEKQ